MHASFNITMMRLRRLVVPCSGPRLAGGVKLHFDWLAVVTNRLAAAGQHHRSVRDALVDGAHHLRLTIQHRGQRARSDKFGHLGGTNGRCDLSDN